MVQLSVFCRVDHKGEYFRTIRVELMGDSAVMVGKVVEVPVWTDSPLRTPDKDPTWAKSIDSTKKHLCCFVKTQKIGKVTIKLTPVGMDGKDYPTREWIIQILRPVTELGDTRDEKYLPGKLHQIDTTKTIPLQPWTTIVLLGDMVQLSAFCRTNHKEENLRTIKVELMGNSVAMAGEVVEVPVWTEPPVPTTGKDSVSWSKNIDDTKKHLCCFLKTEKIGKTIVKLTPIGMDGKDRPTRELIIQVKLRERPSAWQP